MAPPRDPLNPRPPMLNNRGPALSERPPGEGRSNNTAAGTNMNSLDNLGQLPDGRLVRVDSPEWLAYEAGLPNGGSMAGGMQGAVDNVFGSVANARAFDLDPAAFGSSAALQQAYSMMSSQAGGNDAVRMQQMGLIQQLQDQAAGRGPSLAQMQLQQASQQNLNQALSQQAAQRGLGRGAAQRQMIGMRAGVGQNLAAQSAMARLQEQMAARGMLGQQLGGVRGQDLAAMEQLYRQAEAGRQARIEGQRLGSQNRNAFNSTMVGALGAATDASQVPWRQTMATRQQQAAEQKAANDKEAADFDRWVNLFRMFMPALGGASEMAGKGFGGGGGGGGGAAGGGAPGWSDDGTAVGGTDWEQYPGESSGGKINSPDDK